LRYGPFLAQLVVTRRCNLSCGYCSEYDSTSQPIPFATLQVRLEKLRRLRTWAVALMGGEPTLHPDLLQIFGAMRRLGFRRRMMTTNGTRLTKALIEGLNTQGMTDLNVSVDGVKQSSTTMKVLDTLRTRLELLAQHARFRVVLSAVIGSAPPEEVIQVVNFASSHGFSPRVLLLHDESGQIGLSPDQLALYADVKRRIGRAANEAGNYRERLIHGKQAPFRCRAGARYLYVDEFGMVCWCAQTRGSFRKPLLDYTLDDLREQFYTGKSCQATCSVGCVRTVSALDAWRVQRASST
jgi:MoaA/NifB/PqqE/SkfB family radical SAM enzyme